MGKNNIGPRGRGEVTLLQYILNLIVGEIIKFINDRTIVIMNKVNNNNMNNILYSPVFKPPRIQANEPKKDLNPIDLSCYFSWVHFISGATRFSVNISQI